MRRSFRVGFLRGVVAAFVAIAACVPASAQLITLPSSGGGGGGMTYPGAGVAVSTGSAWGTSITLGSGVSTALGLTLNGSGAITATDSPVFIQEMAAFLLL